MKLKFFFVILFFTQITTAQINFNFEFYGGTNFLQTVKADDTLYSINSKLGFQAGINFEKKIKNNLNFGTGLRYLYNKYNVLDIVLEDTGNDTAALFDISVQNIYIQIPLYLKYNFKTNNKLFTPYVKAGINTVFFVKTKSKGINFRILQNNYPEYFNDLIAAAETPYEIGFKEITNKYQFNPFLSTGLSLNIKENIAAGIDISYQMKTNSLKYNTINGFLLFNVFFGIKI